MAVEPGSQERGAKAPSIAEAALMARASQGWLRLSGCVERGEMSAEHALRGLLLYLEAIMKAGPPAAAQRKLEELILGAEARAELGQLRELKPELELRLTEAILAGKEKDARIAALEARVAELQELLEVERVSSVPASVEPAGKPARKSRSIAPVGRARDTVEDWRTDMANVFLSQGFTIDVPRPAVSSDEFAARSGTELVFRPMEVVLPTPGMLAALGLGQDHFVLRPSEKDRIGFAPAAEGYWFLAEVGEAAPRRGGSFEGFKKAAPPGWAILSLEEYFLAWLVMEKVCGVFLDQDASICLRTTYRDGTVGQPAVLQVQNHIDDEGRVEFIVRSIRPDVALPDLGARYRQVVPSLRLPE